MARCNLFKKLSNPTGEFLMFSQFAEDIAKGSTDGISYRVVPSKFAAFNFDFSGLRPYLNTDNTYNITLPEIFQNYMENSAATMKMRFQENNTEWHPKYLNNILWRTLEKYGLIHATQTANSNSGSYNEWSYDELMYVGDIPFYNNRDKDNINYNEIYCYIPINDPRRRYYLESGLGSSMAYDIYSQSEIVGWNANNYPVNDQLENKPMYDDNAKYIVITDTADAIQGRIPQLLYVDNYTNPTYEDLTDEHFEFNSIVVFYDVYNNVDPANPTKIYQNIPLGIYFVGPFQETNIGSPNESRIMQNPVTKYVSNSASFGQGSAYGLRIMTRFSPIPNSKTYWAETTTGEDVASLATIMGRLGDTIAYLKSAMKSANSISQDIKDHLAMFKNYRVNVPYIRNVNNVPTWFVNGRNTGYSAINNYQAVIDDMLRRIAQLEASRTGEDWEAIYRLLLAFNDGNYATNPWDGVIPNNPTVIQQGANNLNQ